MPNTTAKYGAILDRVAARTHKSRLRADEEADVQRWTEAGIERVENELPWNHLRGNMEITLVADTYSYAIPNGFRRPDAESLRWGGEGSYLIYKRRPENIDGAIGPQWKDTATTASQPIYWAESGPNLFIGPKPDTDFVAANPTLYGYGWQTDLYTIANLVDATDKTEVDALTLLVPLWLRELYVIAALCEGLQQEDDSDWNNMENKYEKIIVKYRGDKDVVQINTRPDINAWAQRIEF